MYRYVKYNNEYDQNETIYEEIPPPCWKLHIVEMRCISTNLLKNANYLPKDQKGANVTA